MPAAHLLSRASPGLGSCYYPGSGSVWASTQHPCDLHSEVSMCCPTGWTCFSNQLCIATDADAADADLGSTQRGTCTNPEWDKDTCGNFCLDDKDGGMTACGNETWCCSADVKGGHCDCESGKGTFTIDSGKALALVGFVNNQFTVTTGSAVPTTTGPVVKPSKHASSDSSASASNSGAASTTTASSSAVASSAAAAATNSASATPAQAAAAAAAYSSRLGKILGPIFGILGFLVLLALLWLCWRRRGRRHGTSPTPSPEPHEDLMAYESKPVNDPNPQMISPMSAVGNHHDSRVISPIAAVGNHNDSRMISPTTGNKHDFGMAAPVAAVAREPYRSTAGNQHDFAMAPPAAAIAREPSKPQIASHLRESMHSSTPPAIAMTTNPVVQTLPKGIEHPPVTSPNAAVTQPKRYSGYSPTTITTSSSETRPKRTSGYSPIFSPSASNHASSQSRTGSLVSSRPPPLSPSAGSHGRAMSMGAAASGNRGWGEDSPAVASGAPPPPPPHQQSPTEDQTPRPVYQQPHF